MMRHCFDDLGVRRLEWKCDALNAPSRRRRSVSASPSRAFSASIHRQGPQPRHRLVCHAGQGMAQPGRFRGLAQGRQFRCSGQQKAKLQAPRVLTGPQKSTGFKILCRSIRPPCGALRARAHQGEGRDVPRLEGELNSILHWIEQLNEVDVEGVEPMTSVVTVKMKKRDDVVTDGNNPQDVVTMRRLPKTISSWCRRWSNERPHLPHHCNRPRRPGKRNSRPLN